eukprot:4385340-Pyramimonas_sp.AAC.1
MRFTRPVQRFVAPEGAPTKGPSGAVHMRPPTQFSVSWPNRELHRRSQWRSPHAVPAPSTALRGHRGTSIEGASGAGRM